MRLLYSKGGDAEVPSFQPLCGADSPGLGIDFLSLIAEHACDL